MPEPDWITIDRDAWKVRAEHAEKKLTELRIKQVFGRNKLAVNICEALNQHGRMFAEKVEQILEAHDAK